MNNKQFDIFVIGGGSGGVRAARYASSKGFKVGLAEGLDLGGTCVNRGCIPKKLYSYASSFKDEVDLMNSFGWKTEIKDFKWKKLVFNKKKELSRLNEIYKNLLQKSNVAIFNGYASFLNESQIEINEKIITSKNFIIAVGTKPKKINFSNSNDTITSDEVFDIKNLPKKLLILGGGYIAIELASIFNGFGVDTTVSIRSKNILKGFDNDSAKFLMNQMEMKGVKFLTKKFPIDIKKDGKYLKAYFNNEKSRKFDLVIQAVGREAQLKNLKLDNVDLKLKKNGFICVDNYFRTNKKNIFAIGDIIDRVQLTPVAIYEAMCLIDNFVQKKKKANYKNIPTAVFSNPNFSSVGLSEEEAKKSFKSIEVYTSEFKSLKSSLSTANDRVFIKLITNSSNKKVLGIHFVGENAAEIIQGFSVAVVNGLTKDQFDKTVGIHPTSAEELVTMK